MRNNLLLIVRISVAPDDEIIPCAVPCETYEYRKHAMLCDGSRTRGSKEFRQSTYMIGGVNCQVYGTSGGAAAGLALRMSEVSDSRSANGYPSVDL